jgi:hypothetical protein
MKPCCPPGQGCNAPDGREEACLLQKCRRAETPQAHRAVELWDSFSEARREHWPRRQRRFLRRAYARARDRAVPWRPQLLN